MVGATRFLVDMGRVARLRTIQVGARQDLSPGGVCVLVGLFTTPCGLGRAAWLTALGLQQAGYRVELLDWGRETNTLSPYRVLEPERAAPEKPGLILVHLNPPESTHALAVLRRRDARRYRQVGFWVWETEGAPWSWRLHALAFLEIWTPSNFAARALRSCHGTVHVVPHPCALDAPPLADQQSLVRGRWGIDPGAFVVAFAFDIRSGFERKNPLGLIEAFRRAFPGHEGARLP